VRALQARLQPTPREIRRILQFHTWLGHAQPETAAACTNILGEARGFFAGKRRFD